MSKLCVSISKLWKIYYMTPKLDSRSGSIIGNLSHLDSFSKTIKQELVENSAKHTSLTELTFLKLLDYAFCGCIHLGFSDGLFLV